MTDQFAWWREAIAGRVGEIIEDQPQPGYYKLRDGRDGPWKPVAIWDNGGGLVCRVGSEQRDPHDVWTWCAKNPVGKEDAKHAFETGSWPGDVPQAGDNSGMLSIPEEIDDVVEQATQWLKTTSIDSKTTADMAANWRTRLLDLSKQADKQRDAEKRPHDEASKAVQAKWKPFIDIATNTANKLRDALTVYMRAEEAKARAAAEERARIAREAHEAAQREAAARNAPPPPPPVPVVEEPARVQAGGQRGRKTGLRTVTRYVVTDYAAALAHVQHHPDVQAAVEKVAAAMAKAGAQVPGVEIQKEQVAA